MNANRHELNRENHFEDNRVEIDPFKTGSDQKGKIMNTKTIIKLKTSFDAIQQTVPNSDVEFWYARELMPQLGYSKWQNFTEVIDKARTACKTAGGVTENHFTDVSKMVGIIPWRCTK